MTCDGLGDVVTVSPGNSDYTPAFIHDTKQLLTPYSIDYVITEGGVVVTEGGSTKAAPQPVGAISCTFNDTFSLAGHTYLISGSAIVTIQGKP